MTSNALLKHVKRRREEKVPNEKNKKQKARAENACVLAGTQRRRRDGALEQVPLAFRRCSSSAEDVVKGHTPVRVSAATDAKESVVKLMEA